MRVLSLRFLGAIGALALCAAALLASCAPAGKQAASDQAACADGSARLGGTGLCQQEAAALLRADPAARSPESPNCAWQVNETMISSDEALLYRAALCNGVLTALAHEVGAQSAEISYARSALFGDAAVGRVMIRRFGVDPDPQGALKAALAQAPIEEQAICEIRPANYEGWPQDALLIAPTAAARAKMPQDEPIAACGPLGVDEDSIRYWRVAQGSAWFYDLGQDELDFDPASLVLVVKDAEGAWAQKP